jgi:flagellar biosynthetic protein FliS
MLAFDKYKEVAAKTSGSLQQLIFIFDEVVKLLHLTKKAIQEDNRELKFKTISRIVEVFYILKSGINPDLADKSTKSIDMFYGATIAYLEDANIKDVTPEQIQILIDAMREVSLAIVDSVKNNNTYSDKKNSIATEA